MWINYIILLMSELLNKAKFKARRGLNELDKIFVPFVERHFKNLSEQEISELFRLFEIDDVILADIIIYGKTEYPEELKGIFIKLFKFYSEI